MSESYNTLGKYRASAFGELNYSVEDTEPEFRIIMPENRILKPALGLPYFVNYGFSTGANGDYRNMAFPYGDYDQVMQNRNGFAEAAGMNLSEMVFMSPVHGTRAVVVGDEQRGLGAYKANGIARTDSLMTSRKRVGLALNAADCIPGIVADRKGKVALFHGGREGTMANIAAHTVRAMNLMWASNPEDLFIALGPAVCRDHYALPYLLTDNPEVDGEYLKLTSETAKISIDKVTSGPSIGKFKVSPSDTEYFTFDLQAKTIDQLKAVGIPTEQIKDSGLCTVELSKNATFPSHLMTRIHHSATGNYPESRFTTWVQIKD